jgi:O-antigen ligase
MGLAISWLATRLGQPEILLVVCLLPMSGLALLRHGGLEPAVLGIVLVAAVVRVTLPTGTQSRIGMSLLMTAGVVGLWIGKMVSTDKRLRLRRAPTSVPLIGFVLVCLISYVWGNVFRDPLVITWDTWPFVQLGELAVMLLLPGALIVTANTLREMKWIVSLVVVILLIGTVAIAAHFLHFPLHFLQVRPLFPTWFISLAYALALFNRRLPWTLRLLLLLLAGAWFYRVLIQGFRWLSAWMPAFSGIAAISFFRSRKLLIVLAVVFVVYAVANWAAYAVQLEEEAQVSGETRLDAWLHNWRVTGKHLLFGVGPAGYAVYYMTYFPTEALATHSTYIDIISQTGIVGLFFFLWFFAALLAVVLRLRRWTRGRSDFVEAFTLAAIGGYVGTVLAMGLGDWIIPFVYTQTIAGFDYAVYTWILLGAALSLYHILAEQRGIEG